MLVVYVLNAAGIENVLSVLRNDMDVINMPLLIVQIQRPSK